MFLCYSIKFDLIPIKNEFKFASKFSQIPWTIAHTVTYVYFLVFKLLKKLAIG